MDPVLRNLQKYQEVYDNPEHFLVKDTNDSILTHLLQTTYNAVRVVKKKSLKSREQAGLKQLTVKHFDHEQIWQQIQLRNEAYINGATTRIPQFVARKSDLWFVEVINDLEDPNDDGGSNDEIDHEGSNDETNTYDAGELDGKSDSEEDNAAGRQKSVVDDEFFNLDDMNRFLDIEDKRFHSDKTASGLNEDDGDESGSEESVDLFQDKFSGDDADEEGPDTALTNPRYKDFFVKSDVSKRAKRTEQFEEVDERQRLEREHLELRRQHVLEQEQQRQQRATADDEDMVKSTLQHRMERLGQRIEQLEAAALREKEWQQKGEIKADDRPKNSLLDTVLKFDLSARPAPVITEKTTLLLEDVIRQRIKDKSFDSVQRKDKPVESLLSYRKQLVLNQEKSKESLAQIYEKEYLQQQQQQQPAQNDDVNATDVNPAHSVIESKMTELFSNLDMLCNFHFTPRLVAPEVRIVSNLPAISMEETAPVATNEATLLAPQEIQRPTKGQLTGETERSKTDKHRERRKKKIKQRIHAKANTKTPKPVVAKRQSKANVSSTFFAELQEKTKVKGA